MMDRILFKVARGHCTRRGRNTGILLSKYNILLVKEILVLSRLVVGGKKKSIISVELNEKTNGLYRFRSKLFKIEKIIGFNQCVKSEVNEYYSLRIIVNGEGVCFFLYGHHHFIRKEIK